MIIDIALEPLRYIQIINNKIRVLQVMPKSTVLCFKKETFYSALCIEVPALVENDNEFFKNVYGLYRPHGILIVTLANRLSYRCFLHLLRLKYQHKTEVMLLYKVTTNETIKKAISVAFSILKTKGYNWIPFKKESHSRLISIISSLEKML